MFHRFRSQIWNLWYGLLLALTAAPYVMTGPQSAVQLFAFSLRPRPQSHNSHSISLLQYHCNKKLCTQHISCFTLNLLERTHLAILYYLWEEKITSRTVTRSTPSSILVVPSLGFPELFHDFFLQTWTGGDQLNILCDTFSSEEHFWSDCKNCKIKHLSGLVRWSTLRWILVLWCLKLSRVLKYKVYWIFSYASSSTLHPRQSVGDS